MNLVWKFIFATLVVALGVPAGCRRGGSPAASAATAPSAATQKAFAGLYVIKGGDFYRSKGRPARIELRDDGSFSLVGLPASQIGSDRSLLEPGEGAVGMEGRWKPETDPDGDVIIRLDAREVNRRTLRQSLVARPTQVPEAGLVLEIGNVSVSFVKVVRNVEAAGTQPARIQ